MLVWVAMTAWGGNAVGVGVVNGLATFGGEIAGATVLGGGTALIAGAMCEEPGRCEDNAQAAVIVGALGGLVGGGMGGSVLGARGTERRVQLGLVATGAVGLAGVALLASASGSDSLGPGFSAGLVTLAAGVPLAGGIAGAVARPRGPVSTAVVPMVDPSSGAGGVQLAGMF